MRGRHVLAAALVMVVGALIFVMMFPYQRDALLTHCEPARLERDCQGLKAGTVFATKCRPMFGKYDEFYFDTPEAPALSRCAWDPAPGNFLRFREQHKQ